MDGPEPEQAVVRAVGPVDSRVDVFLNVSSDHPDHDVDWWSPENVGRSLYS